MSNDDTDRDEGVDFTALDPVLQDLSYPVTKSEFVDNHGEFAIERTNAAPITVERLFEGTGSDTFDSAADVRESVLNLMPRESVGRQRYSDRGGSGPADSPAIDSDHSNESL